MIDDLRTWELLRGVAREGAARWPALAAELEPDLAAFAKRQPIGRLRDHEDTPREIVTRVLARLHAHEFAAIHKLCALDPPPVLQAWLRVMVRRAAIDYMRASPEYERATSARPDRWVSLASLSSANVAPNPDSLVIKRAQVTAFVRAMVERAEASEGDPIARLALEWKIERIHTRRLVQRGRRYLAVLGAVLAGNSYPEVASELGISRREVELSVRYLEELLAARGFAG